MRSYFNSKFMNLLMVMVLFLGQLTFLLPTEMTVSATSIDNQLRTEDTYEEAVTQNVYENMSIDVLVVGDQVNGTMFNQTVEGTAGEKALAVLKKAVGESNVVTTTTDYGEMITSINGLAAADTYYWSFEVNGKAATVGADAYEVQVGDQIAFKYISWSTAKVTVEGNTPTSNFDGTIEITAGEKALAVLKKAVGESNLVTTTTDYGEMITSINGLTVAGTYYWSFEVNGKAATVGADSYEVQVGDQIAFKYISWSTANVTVEGKNSTPTFDETIEITAGEKALAVLKNAVGESNVVTSTTDYGEMITSINGLVAADTYYWSFEVNGKAATVGADAYEVQVGDQIAFKYISWEQDGEGDDLVDPDPDSSFIDPPTEYDQNKLSQINEMINNVSTKILENGIQSDWDAIAVSLSGKQVPYSYLKDLEQKIKDENATFNYATDYGRIILTLRALEANPEDIGGYNLIEKLYNLDNLTQYTNSIIFSILAMDSGSYTVPAEAKWSKQQLISELLNKQNNDGGWSWYGSQSDIDVTGMALTALSPYIDQENVKAAINNALTWLTAKQQDSGGFLLENGDPSPAISQIIIGLTSNGISPSNQAFTKATGNIMDHQLSYYKENENLFYTEKSGAGVATQQALQALIAYKNYINGKENVYLFTEVGGTAPDDSKPEDEVIVPSIEKSIRVTVKGLNHTTIVSETVTVTGDATPYSVLVEAVGSGNVKKSGSGSNLYVIEINGLAEFDHGPKSGWNFSVNDGFPSTSSGTYQLNDGDSVKWLYTTDLGKDVGAEEIPIIPNIEQDDAINSLIETVNRARDNVTGISFDNKQSIQDVLKTVHVENASKKMSQEEINELKELVTNNIVKQSKTVSHEGALIADSKNELVFYIPENALKSEMVIEINETDDDKQELLTSIYEFTPDGTQFEKPVYISLKVPLALDDLNNLALVWLNEEKQQWVPIPAIVNAQTGEVTGLVNHFTKFAVIDRSKLEVTPKDISISDAIQSAIQYLSEDDGYSEWEAFALEKANHNMPNKHQDTIKSALLEVNGEFRKVTDIERYALTARALGLDPQNIEGINLIKNIYSNERMLNQGLNGPIFALITLNSGKYEIPLDARWSKEKLLKYILSSQNEDGGFALVKGDPSNVDITAMAITALSDYQEQDNVQKIIDQAVQWLSESQLENGGYNAEGIVNSESVAQVIIALTSNGIDPRGKNFKKAYGDLITNLLSYQNKNGGFSNLSNENSDQIASEQALMALVAYDNWINIGEKLYKFKDIEKNEVPIKETTTEKYLDDSKIAGYAYQSVYRLKDLGIMQGVSKVDPIFAPKQLLTRAEFSKIIVELLKDSSDSNSLTSFIDVKKESWYYKYINRAYQLGIVNGVSQEKFAPNAYITREQLALMVQRAFRFKHNQNVDIFKDTEKLSIESKQAISALNEYKIMQGYNNSFRPEDYVSREMAATVIDRIYLLIEEEKEEE